jgi:hypothetical protein
MMIENLDDFKTNLRNFPNDFIRTFRKESKLVTMNRKVKINVNKVNLSIISIN